MRKVQVVLNLPGIPKKCGPGSLGKLEGCPFYMIGCSYDSCSAIIRGDGCVGPEAENECPKDGRRSDCPFNKAKTLNKEPFNSCSCCEHYDHIGLGRCKITNKRKTLHNGCRKNYTPKRVS